MRRETYDLAVEAIRKAISLGFQHCDHAIRIEGAAREANYSPFHFQKLFAAITGESWAGFHRRLRLECAAIELAKTDAQINAISVEFGFESAEHFIRAFGTAFGEPPNQFRKRRLEKAILPTPNGVHAQDLASLNRFQPKPFTGPWIESSIVERSGLKLRGRRYRGPLQLISQAWRDLAIWADKKEIDLTKRQLVTFAETLDDDIAPEDQIAFVALDDQGESELESFVIPGGNFLTAKHKGSGHLLADFWLRLYAENIPALGVQLRPAPAYQIYPSGLFVEDPETFETDVFIPVF